MRTRTSQTDAFSEPFSSLGPPPNRRSFLRWTGTAGVGLALGACGKESPTSLLDSEPVGAAGHGSDHKVTVDGPMVALPLSDDTDILKFALFLELLEAEFYKMAVASDLLDGKVLDMSRNVRDHEICHVTYLQAALGDAATGNEITFDFSATLENERKYLDAAETFEQTGVGAYLGALPLISDKNIRSVAGTIFTVEARHTSAFRALNERPDPAPVVFEDPLSPDEVVSGISPFVVEGL